MAEDMARDTNGNSQDLHDAATRIGILSQRTTNLETVVGDIRREFNQSISAVNTSIGAMSSKVDERFNSIAATIAERSRPQWQAMSVMLGAVVVLGGLVYWPIREQTADLKTANIATNQTIQALSEATNQSIQALADKVVTRQEMDWRSARGSEDRIRTEAAIIDLRSGTVGRNEWEQKNSSRDHDIENIRESQAVAITNVQRQLDQLRTDLTSLASSLGNGRDSFADMKEEIRRLEQRLDSFRNGSTS